MSSDPSFLGTVQDVSGSVVSVLLAGVVVSGAIHVDGHVYRVGQVGSFVRIPCGLAELFGVVTKAGVSAVPDSLSESSPFGRLWMTVHLVAEAPAGHRSTRGTAYMPTVGDPVHVVTEPDLARLYGADASLHAEIGTVAGAPSVPARLNINALVTRHSAIVGATGSGKSTAVTKILSAIADEARYPSARVMLLDVHDEYASAFGDRARVLRVNSRTSHERLEFPFWALTFEELLPLTFGNLDDSARGAVRDEIVELKRDAVATCGIASVTVAEVTVDTPIPFCIHELWLRLHSRMNATHTEKADAQSPLSVAFEQDDHGAPTQPGDAMKVIAPRFRPETKSGATKIYLSGSPLNIRRQVDSLGSRLRDKRYDFLFRPGPWTVQPDGASGLSLSDFLDRWLNAPQTITVLDLSGVPASILDELVGALTRVMYDALFWARDLSEGGRERPLLMVFEEAHRYFGDGPGTTRAAVQRIVREGRKYGVSAMIVSQRPSEIDATVLSQCGTLVALRLGNSADRSRVAAAVSDQMVGMMEMLPVLRTGEALVMGEAVPLPMRVSVELPARLPNSLDPCVVGEIGPGGWDRRREPTSYEDVADRWLTQVPRSSNVLAEADSESGPGNESPTG